MLTPELTFCVTYLLYKTKPQNTTHLNAYKYIHKVDKLYINISCINERLGIESSQISKNWYFEMLKIEDKST